MRFKIFGTEIYISFLFAVVISIMLLTDKTGMALPCLFAVLMHEIGHLFCMWVLDNSPKSVKLIPASVQITSSFSGSYKKDLTVALMGPCVNFILFFTLYLNYLVFHNETTLYYAVINLIIGLFNMLPVKGLDGGTILFCILSKKYDFNRCCLIIKLLTFAIAIITLITAITLTLNGKINISLYIIATYLFITVLLKI